MISKCDSAIIINVFGSNYINSMYIHTFGFLSNYVFWEIVVN